MNPDMENAAREWTIRVQHPDFDDWDGLSQWMAEDVRNADEFNRLSLLDQDIAHALGQAQPVPSADVIPLLRDDAAGVRSGRRRSAQHWYALAASIMLLAMPAGLWIRHAMMGSGASSAIAIATRPGERRNMALPDGTRIAIAGGTRLSVDADGRSVTMEEGQATFRVTHDPARPFAVKLAGVTVTDVGTLFDVRQRQGESIVSVGQGEVRVTGAGDPIDLTAGRRLSASSRSALRTDAIRPGSVGGWQRGVLDYSDTAIADVAADIASLTGTRIAVSPRAAGLRFSGAITIDGDPERALRRIAPLLGVSVRRHGETWA